MLEWTCFVGCISRLVSWSVQWGQFSLLPLTACVERHSRIWESEVSVEWIYQQIRCYLRKNAFADVWWEEVLGTLPPATNAVDTLSLERLSLLGNHTADSKLCVKESWGRPDILHTEEQIDVECFSQLPSPFRRRLFKYMGVIYIYLQRVLHIRPSKRSVPSTPSS